MTPRTDTSPPTDRRMWRRLVARAHPDRAGDQKLFIWTCALHEHVTGEHVEDARTRQERRRPPPHPSTGERIDYAAAEKRMGRRAGWR